MKSNLENALKNVEISSKQMRMMNALENQVLGLTKRCLGQDVYSTGSSASFTYLPDEKGLPEDMDLYILDSQNKDLGELISKVGKNKSRYERLFEKIYKTPVELRVQEAKENKECDFKQVFYEVMDKETGKRLMKLDFNYDDCLDGSEKYRSTFDAQMEDIISKLSEKDKARAKSWITANVRALKNLLAENKVYKPKDGGLRGIGCEQVMLQLKGNYKASNLKEVKENYNVGMVLKKIYNQGMNMELTHPVTGKDITDKLKKKDNAGWEKLVEVAKEHDKYMPVEPEALKTKVSKMVTKGVEKARDYMDSVAMHYATPVPVRA